MPKTSIAVIGSHSALDVCRGAKDEGLATIVIVEKGRDQTYTKYFKTQSSIGCVDEVLYVEKFKDILNPKFQKILKAKDAIFIPHRSFEVYINDYDAIEKDFKIPIFGNKFLLRSEERTESKNQYHILEEAGIRYPKIFKDPKKIDTLVLVKVPEKERGFERAFFMASSPADYNKTSAQLIKSRKITKKDLDAATIEEYVLGVQVNFNFFYSPLSNRLELIGTDTRRQTNIEGFLKIPANQQEKFFSEKSTINKKSFSPKNQQSFNLKYEEAGHIAVTTLESMLEPAFEIGEKFVKASKTMFPPGVIGPFSLQSQITPGPPKKEIVVFDVSPRMPGSPGIFATPYSGYLYGKSISMGRRVAMEINFAIAKRQMNKITT